MTARVPLSQIEEEMKVAEVRRPVLPSGFGSYLP